MSVISSFIVKAIGSSTAAFLGERLKAKLLGTNLTANSDGTMGAPGKSIFQSKTIWGLFLAAATPFISAYLAKYGISVGEWQSAVNEAIQAFGVLLSIYGRVTARKQVGSA